MNNSHLILHLQPLYRSIVLMLYVGPDAVMPLLSILGAIAGAVLMWWRRLASLARRVFKSSAAKEEVTSKTSK